MKIKGECTCGAVFDVDDGSSEGVSEPDGWAYRADSMFRDWLAAHPHGHPSPATEVTLETVGGARRTVESTADRVQSTFTGERT